MPKGRPSTGSWVKHKLNIFNQRNCYIYKRPTSAIWQYYLQIDGEGQLRRSTGIEGDSEDINVGQREAIQFAEEKYLQSKAKEQAGMKAIVTKKLFDLMDDFLAEEEKRITPYNMGEGWITEETWRGKNHHLRLLKKMYGDTNIPIEKIDFKKLYEYPEWRRRTTCRKQNPIAIKPPKTQQAILAELSTIRAYFAYLVKEGYMLKVPEFKRIIREKRQDTRRDFLTERQYKQTLNTIRAWSNSKIATKTQLYNRQVLYNSIIIMTNSLLRKGTFRNLVWRDLDVADNIPKEEQKQYHLIRVRKETVKVGTKRTVISPTVVYFNRIRELVGIPKKPNSRFPHIPEEFLDMPVISKYNHLDLRMGDGTWDRCWQELKDKCKSRYWGQKNITWYSFRHTGISFNIEREVPLITLTKTAGTSCKELELTYYHHQDESKRTWEILNKNRIFYDRVKKSRGETLVDIADMLPDLDGDED